jgi:hypothetical protein
VKKRREEAAPAPAPAAPVEEETVLQKLSNKHPSHRPAKQIQNTSTQVPQSILQSSIEPHSTPSREPKFSSCVVLATVLPSLITPTPCCREERAIVPRLPRITVLHVIPRCVESQLKKKEDPAMNEMKQLFSLPRWKHAGIP